MVSVLKDWISNIIAVIFFITLIEMLLPDGKTKKYIGFITGILVIITIMTPVVKVLGGELKLELPELNQTEEFSESALKQQGQKINEFQTKQIIKVYKEKLQNSVKDLLKDIKEVKCTEVVCQIYEDRNRLGEIKMIEVFLKDNSQKKESSDIKSVEININIKRTEKDQALVKVPNLINEKIVKRIIDTYKVNSSQVKVAYTKSK